ncbi:hypothetical protein PHSY_006462 [Pseudozyma hubeiensis SY62]|uniref:Uncharacterized protein n=1 Tax=Pseudozyma hubeiensis (strain SY62) TaxID=1305764 RepID=R9PCC8_PSEHS|nr:hypothetical protein PHSY_006462 [Pseudozyma hubeiensis SY62]GAC98867.1 hypothetical protein PHSY_006462 [Pseudozyma hubeiensis SY62]
MQIDATMNANLHLGEQGLFVAFRAQQETDTEIWERIVLFLLPEIRPEEHIHPQPNGKNLWDRTLFWPTHQSDLKALALTCKQLKALALPALLYAPFLQDERVNDFVRFICQNERRRLVPASSEAASTIKALHVQSEMFDMHIHSYAGYDKSFQQSFCTCDLHVLFSLAENVRYVSLECLDGRECEVCFQLHPSEGATNHIFAHFLSSTTVCRPTALRWIYNSSQKKQLSLQDATSYEPLSQLTSLELLNISPPEEFVAFLTRDLASAERFPEVQEAISAGFSPNKKLQRLRLTTTCMGFLSYFEQYMEELAATAAGEYFDHMDSLPDYDEEYETLTRLHELASKSWMLPNLRLLVLEIPSRGRLYSEDALKGLVDRDVLQDLSSSFQRDKPKYPDHAASKLSSLFDASKRSGNLIDDASPFHDIAVNLDKVDREWRKRLAEHDSFWLGEQIGKHALTALWNSSRFERGLKETEIRIVAERESLTFRDRLTHLDEGFFCQAESVAQVGTRSKKGALQWSSSDGVIMEDDGVWADPDIFSLVDTMPWLSYHQHNEYGCCSWSGELPRDNNPTSSSDGNTPRVVLPALIKMDDKQLDELGRLRRNPSRRARKSTDEQATESNRKG